MILRKNVILSDKFDTIFSWVENQEEKVDLFYGDEDHLSENKVLGMIHYLNQDGIENFSGRIHYIVLIG